MIDYKKILVPFDFSNAAERALEHAIRIAGAFGAEVDIVHVWEPTPHLPTGAMLWMNGEAHSFWEHMRDTLSKRLDDHVAKLVGDKEIDISKSVESGWPADTVLRLLKERGHDLVVMGTHGRRGLSYLVMGSIATRVVRESPCPVLTVRADEKEKEKETR